MNEKNSSEIYDRYAEIANQLLANGTGILQRLVELKRLDSLTTEEFAETYLCLTRLEENTKAIQHVLNCFDATVGENPYADYRRDLQDTVDMTYEIIRKGRLSLSDYDKLPEEQKERLSGGGDEEKATVN